MGLVRRTTSLLAMLLAGLGTAAPAWAAIAEPIATDLPTASSAPDSTIRNTYPGPTQGREAYRAIFSALRQGNWDEAKGRALLLEATDPVRAVALSELYTAKNSPKAELFDLLDLIEKASWLPSADQLARMAQKRGAQSLPSLPQIQKLAWVGGASRREYLAPTRQDALAQALVTQIVPFIKNDNPAGAEALLLQGEAGLSPDGIAEVRQRIAWSYYIGNDDANARRMADLALQSGSTNDWAMQAHWTKGLSAWRQNDPRTASDAFSKVVSLARNDDMAAAGAYWAARAFMNAGDPRRVEPLLRIAAQKEDSFYGMLARETLGLTTQSARHETTTGWSDIRNLPTVRAAIALHDIQEDALASELIKRQADLDGTAHYDQLVALSASLGLADTQLWLASRGPAGRKPNLFARFPTPKWRPEGGWRIDPALIYAHALQESGFRPTVVSPAGARGVMQVMPGTASQMAGAPVSAEQLNSPSTNVEFGQRYLEMLRDNSATGGLLPKVMAAYNAGPQPVSRWNTQVRDGGDPLLFIESLPYYETRAYVNTVMRNYWVYEIQGRGKADALTVMAQGKWPRFPKVGQSDFAQDTPSKNTAAAWDKSESRLSYNTATLDAH